MKTVVTVRVEFDHAEFAHFCSCMVSHQMVLDMQPRQDSLNYPKETR